jgi:LPXTG-motif cell wall-anchored protein
MGLAAPASAHKAIVKGWTSCSDTNHVVIWSIGNDFNTEMTINSATAQIGGQPVAVTGYTSPVGDQGTTSATSIVPGPTTGTITLTVHVSWPDRVTDTEQASVDLVTDCNHGSSTTTTTLPPTTTGAPTTTEAPTTTIAPPTTEASSTTEAPTTTIAPPTTEASTTTEAPTTSIGEQGSTTVPTGGSSTTGPGETTTVPPGATTTMDTPITGLGGPTTVPPGATATGNLPRTGSDTNYPLMFGVSCLAGGALLALRRRRAWTR